MKKKKPEGIKIIEEIAKQEKVFEETPFRFHECDHSKCQLGLWILVFIFSFTIMVFGFGFSYWKNQIDSFAKPIETIRYVIRTEWNPEKESMLQECRNEWRAQQTTIKRLRSFR